MLRCHRPCLGLDLPSGAGLLDRGADGSLPSAVRRALRRHHVNSRTDPVRSHVSPCLRLGARPVLACSSRIERLTSSDGLVGAPTRRNPTPTHASPMPLEYKLIFK